MIRLSGSVWIWPAIVLILGSGLVWYLGILQLDFSLRHGFGQVFFFFFFQLSDCIYLVCSSSSLPFSHTLLPPALSPLSRLIWYLLDFTLDLSQKSSLIIYRFSSAFLKSSHSSYPPFTPHPPTHITRTLQQPNPHQIHIPYPSPSPLPSPFVCIKQILLPQSLAIPFPLAPSDLSPNRWPPQLSPNVAPLSSHQLIQSKPVKTYLFLTSSPCHHPRPPPTLSISMRPCPTLFPTRASHAHSPLITRHRTSLKLNRSHVLAPGPISLPPIRSPFKSVVATTSISSPPHPPVPSLLRSAVPPHRSPRASVPVLPIVHLLPHLNLWAIHATPIRSILETARITRSWSNQANQLVGRVLLRRNHLASWSTSCMFLDTHISISSHFLLSCHSLIAFFHLFHFTSRSRGKRIQYDASEDLLDTGDSPFTLSAPKLLFPSSPSPPPRLELIEPSGSNSRPADSFETPRPKRVQNVLPTPQTRSRPGRPATSSASQAGGPIAKAMR